MDNDVVEELRKIVLESLQSEEGNLNKAVDLAINFSTKNSISSDELFALSAFYGSKGSYELVYIFAKTSASLSTGPAKVAAYYNAGTASYFLNLPMEAEEQYKLALEADPNDADTHCNYGNLLSEMGRSEEAEKQYKLALKADPKNVNTHCDYGNLLKQMRRSEEAEKQYKLALKADPNNVNTHSNYGILLKQMRRLEEAEEQYKLAMEADPNVAATHYNYGNLLKQMGRREEAEKQYKLALIFNLKHVNIYYNYGLLLYEMGRSEEAEKQYKLALEADPKHVSTRYNYGLLLYEMGRSEEAEKQYKLALEADPKHVNTHCNYGYLLSEMGRSEEAEKQYKLALEADPNDADTHCNYGNLLSEMGRSEEAEKQYKLALIFNPKHVATHSNYGNLLRQIGHPEEAEEQYKIALELDPNEPNSHGAYGLLLFFRNLEEEAINETEIASRLYRENGDKVKEHLSLAWLYEKFANKYYNLKDYKKSGEYAEISGDEYIEAGKQAGENFTDTSLTKGYTLKGRAQIRKLELQPPYEIEKFKEIMSGIYEASKCYNKAAEISPKDNQICNACSTSMLCLSEMLDYMLAVIKQKNVSRLEDETEKWKKQLTVSEQIYKGSKKGEAFVQSLYKLMACIENLDKYKKFAMWKEERVFEECVEELKEIAGNIEGPLQKIIEDSAAQMDICRHKIMPYAGTETGIFEPQTPRINDIDTPVEPKQDDLRKPTESKKGNNIIKWIVNHPIKSAGSVIFAVILNHYNEILFSIIQKFVNTLLSYI